MTRIHLALDHPRGPAVLYAPTSARLDRAIQRAMRLIAADWQRLVGRRVSAARAKREVEAAGSRLMDAAGAVVGGDVRVTVGGPTPADLM